MDIDSKTEIGPCSIFHKFDKISLKLLQLTITD